jgi:PAS domain-containing protein
MAEAKAGLPATASDFQLARSDAAIDTFFASLGRDGLQELRSATALLRGAPLLREIVDAMPVPVTVLNQKGQVVLMNRRACQWLETGLDCALGKRHGDLLCCIHAPEGSDGCGTSRHCLSCGAAVSISTTQECQGQAVHEYRLRRITRLGEQAMELEVTTTPLRVEGRTFTIFAVRET